MQSRSCRRLQRAIARGRVRSAGLVTAAVAAALLAGPAPVGAQWTVYDPANYAENVLHYVNQMSQIRYQLQQLQYQLQALSKLRVAAWRDVQSPLREIQSLMGGARTLGYAAPGVAGTFQGYFRLRSRSSTGRPSNARGRRPRRGVRRRGTRHIATTEGGGPRDSRGRADEDLELAGTGP